MSLRIELPWTSDRQAWSSDDEKRRLARESTEEIRSSVNVKDWSSASRQVAEFLHARLHWALGFQHPDEWWAASYPDLPKALRNRLRFTWDAIRAAPDIGKLLRSGAITLADAECAGRLTPYLHSAAEVAAVAKDRSYARSAKLLLIKQPRPKHVAQTSKQVRVPVELMEGDWKRILNLSRIWSRAKGVRPVVRPSFAAVLTWLCSEYIRLHKSESKRREEVPIEPINQD